jgi:hypothetical protein
MMRFCGVIYFFLTAEAQSEVRCESQSIDIGGAV